MTTRVFLLAAVLLLTASCSRVVPRPEPVPPADPARPQPPTQPVQPPTPPPPATAVEAGVRLVAQQPSFDAEAARRAWEAFRITCPALVVRQDASGLTRTDDWRPLCLESADLTTPAAMAEFFRTRFELVEVGDGAAFATGYYEPEIRGSRVRMPGYEVPVYAKPPELLDSNPLTGQRGRGRIDETGQFVP